MSVGKKDSLLALHKVWCDRMAADLLEPGRHKERQWRRRKQKGHLPKACAYSMLYLQAYHYLLLNTIFYISDIIFDLIQSRKIFHINIVKLTMIF